MASRFEVVDEEYIEELNENTKKSTEYWTAGRTFSKCGRMKETSKQI